MKKTLSILLVLCFCVGMIACGSATAPINKISDTNAPTATPTPTPAVDTLEVAKKAYKDLAGAYYLTDNIMVSVYNAWHYSIYDAREHSSDVNDTLYYFSSAVGLKRDLVTEAFGELIEGSLYDTPLYSSLKGYQLEEASICVGIVQKVQAESITNIKELLDDAKEGIKTVSANSPEASYLQELKDYYSELESYYNFLVSPSGSFAELSGVINGYRKNISSYQSSLSFDLE